MPETLVIEWDRDRLIAAIGAPARQKVDLKSALVVDRQQGQLPAELGHELAAAMKKAGIDVSDAIVVFPRELVTFFRIELPNLPDHELPDMVRLQAATRLTVPVESVSLDFCPLPVKSGSDTRDVLVVTAPQKHVNEVLGCLSACDIDLAGLRVSSFGIGASVVHAGLLPADTAAAGVEAVVSLRDDSIEMIFLNGHHVEFSHSGASWTSLQAVEQAVRAEISRARMAATEDMGSYSVRRLTLIGSPEITAAVPDTISARLDNAEVVRIDPAESLLSCQLPSGLTASDMLAISGAIANVQSPSVESVDLVNPRKAPEKKDYRRAKILAGVGVVVLLVVGFWQWRTSQVQAVEKEIAAIKAEAAKINSDYRNKSTQRRLDLAERIRDWSNRDINWLAEVDRIRELMNGTERVYLTRFQFGVAGRDNAGTISAEGYAKSRKDIEDLMRMLREAGYLVTPSAITQSMRDSGYAMALTLDLTIPVNRASVEKVAADKSASENNDT